MALLRQVKFGREPESRIQLNFAVGVTRVAVLADKAERLSGVRQFENEFAIGGSTYGFDFDPCVFWAIY